MHIIIPSFPPHHCLLLIMPWRLFQSRDAFIRSLYRFMCHHQETQLSCSLGEQYFNKPLKDAGFLKLCSRNLWRDLCMTLSLQKKMELEVKEKHGLGRQLCYSKYSQNGTAARNGSWYLMENWLLVLTVAKVKTTTWFTKAISSRAFFPGLMSVEFNSRGLNPGLLSLIPTFPFSQFNAIASLQ